MIWIRIRDGIGLALLWALTIAFVLSPVVILALVLRLAWESFR